MEAWGGAWGLRFIHHFLQASLWAGGFLTTGLEMNWSCHPEPARVRLAAAGVAVTGSLGFPLRCFGVAVVRFPDTSSWVLCLDVGGLDVVRSPRVSFQKRWLLGRRQQPGWAAPRGVAVSTGHGAASLLCPAVQLLLGAPLPPLPSAGSKVAFFLPASDWRPGGFPGASVFGCRPHFQSASAEAQESSLALAPTAPAWAPAPCAARAPAGSARAGAVRRRPLDVVVGQVLCTQLLL